MGDEVKEGLYSFAMMHQRIAIMVDCENADPIRLCAALRNLIQNCPEALEHIQKIVLYDDINGDIAWRALYRYFELPIVHELIKRLKHEKSLVDIKMTAGTCKEYYKNDIPAFILVSSDSDFWGLISSLPEAHFLVMVEHEKLSGAMKEKLEENNITYCYTDTFCQRSIGDIKEGALLEQIRPYIENSMHLNINSMMDSIYSRTRMQFTECERAAFIDKYIKTMKLEINENGDVIINVG